MIDPATIAASAIAKIAFDEFVKAGAGAAAKETVDGAVKSVQKLRDQIKAKFQGNEQATAALAEVEQNGSEAALKEVGECLDSEMGKEKGFADKVRQMAQEIINIQNQSSMQIGQQNINLGRDQNIINQPKGDIRIGGS